MSELSINLQSSILCGPTDFTVVLPNPKVGNNAGEYYSSGKKYKVLWLLHAGLGDRHDWLRNTNIAYYAQEREFIIVVPNGLNSDFANHPQFADGYNFCDFFFDELMPFVYNWLPASDDPADNYLAGFSMGGAAAWMYGLLHPKKFNAIVPLSSPPRNYQFLDEHRNMSASLFRSMLTADRKTFPSGYGNPKNGMLVKEINMISKYNTVGDFLDSMECTWERFREVVEAGKLPDIFMLCGRGERGFPKIEKFKEYAESLGVTNITYDFVEGEGHSYLFWNDLVPKMLDYLKL